MIQTSSSQGRLRVFLIAKEAVVEIISRFATVSIARRHSVEATKDGSARRGFGRMLLKFI